MNAWKTARRERVRHIARRAAALLSVLALVSNSFILGARAQRTQKEQAGRDGEDQRILHVLNRLGFGPRPGDVERVRAMGLERYVDGQLHPEKIEDAVAEAKVKNLPTLSMSTVELLAKYPNPGLLVRQLQRRGELPADLAALRENRQRVNQQPPNAGNAPKIMDAPEGDKKPAQGENPDGNNNEFRRAVLEYMRENNLQPPQRIMAELQASRILRAVYSERQLQEVMVDFWTNHFNVFAGKGADRWFLTSYDRDVIRPHAMGRFRDLLGATAKSPAMLFYLDNFQSVSPNAQAGRGQGLRALMEMLGGDGRRGRNRDRVPPEREGANAQAQRTGQRPPPPQQRRRRGINENYARELMELHTLGVDGGYTQKDVQEVARAFTGWTILDPRGFSGNESAAKFYFNPRLHDDGEKVVLGHKIPAGGGIRDGEMIMDILARHPSTAKFMATKLCRRFVADDPSPALVGRVAAAFTKSDGDIRQTLSAIFTSPEFNAPETRRAKIKTPFELAISSIRALGGETDARPALHQWVARMGEPLYLYQAPTGYPDTAEAWVNTGALLERLNFALALVSNRIPGTRIDLARFAGDAAASSRPVDQERVVDQFLNLILQGNVSPRTRATLMKQLSEQNATPIPATETTETAGAVGERRNRGGMRRGMQAAEGVSVGNPEVARIAALILGSPEFQRQ